MILYVNGDSHTSAAEAVNPHAFASDDPNFQQLKLNPHPDNLAVSWGKKLSTLLKSTNFICDAESAASNDRIIRTTNQWIGGNRHMYDNTLIVIGWSTWSREEWLIDNVYYQLNNSGNHCVPSTHSTKYKEYILSMDLKHKNNLWNTRIWELHKKLNKLSIKHVFFNCNHQLDVSDEKEWGANYISPYDQDMTYDAYLKHKKYKFNTGYHYDESAHNEWAEFLLNYIKTNNIL